MEFTKKVLLIVIFSLSGACAGNLSKGTYFHKQGNYEKAIQYYSEALVEENNLSEPLYYLIYNARGISYFNNRQFDLAIADYSKTISLKPDFSEAHYNRALAFEQKQEYDQAFFNFKEAINLNPEFSKAYVGRGFLFEKLGQNEQALAEYNKALALDENFVEAYTKRGTFYWKTKQYDLALKDYDSAIARKPFGYSVYLHRGFANFYSEHYVDASNDFENAIQNFNGPTLSVYATLWHFLALERQGKNGNAALKEMSKQFNLQEWPGIFVSLYHNKISPTEIINKTVDNNEYIETSKKCYAYFHLGQYYLLQGKISEAIDMFQKAVTFGKYRSIEFYGALEELGRLHLWQT